MAKKNIVDDGKTKLSSLQAQVDDLDLKWKRALADYANLQKRVSNQQTLMAKIAGISFVEKLLPIIDDLKRAQAHLQDQGLEMVVKHLMDMLKNEGVEQIETTGALFDPSTMEAVEVVEGQKDTVVREVLTGYRMGDTVVRPAKVEVGNGKVK